MLPNSLELIIYVGAIGTVSICADYYILFILFGKVRVGYCNNFNVFAYRTGIIL